MMVAGRQRQGNNRGAADPDTSARGRSPAARAIDGRAPDRTRTCAPALSAVLPLLPSSRSTRVGKAPLLASSIAQLAGRAARRIRDT